MDISGLRIPIQSASIVIVGLARNCADHIGASLFALDRATAAFRERQFVVIESDSNDETLKSLEGLKLSVPMHVEALGQLQRSFPERTARIAHCRNRAIELVRERFGSTDYVIVADLDGVNEGLNARAIEDGWSRDEPWDVLTANQSDAYYDIWALRHRSWSPNDCWQAARELETIFGRRIARAIAVHSRQVKLPADGALVEVDSAFGGLAIYRREAFLAASYSGTADGSETCEHVPYHLALRSKGFRIFINPALLNQSPPDHLTASTSTSWKSLVWRILGR